MSQHEVLSARYGTPHVRCVTHMKQNPALSVCFVLPDMQQRVGVVPSTYSALCEDFVSKKSLRLQDETQNDSAPEFDRLSNVCRNAEPQNCHGKSQRPRQDCRASKSGRPRNGELGTHRDEQASLHRELSGKHQGLPYGDFQECGRESVRCKVAPRDYSVQVDFQNGVDRRIAGGKLHKGEILGMEDFRKCRGESHRHERLLKVQSEAQGKENHGVTEVQLSVPAYPIRELRRRPLDHESEREFVAQNPVRYENQSMLSNPAPGLNQTMLSNVSVKPTQVLHQRTESDLINLFEYALPLTALQTDMGVKKANDKLPEGIISHDAPPANSSPSKHVIMSADDVPSVCDLHCNQCAPSDKAQVVALAKMENNNFPVTDLDYSRVTSQPLAARMNPFHAVRLNESEFRKQQETHRNTLDQLNLDVENLIMPDKKTRHPVTTESLLASKISLDHEAWLYPLKSSHEYDSAENRFDFGLPRSKCLGDSRGGRKVEMKKCESLDLKIALGSPSMKKKLQNLVNLMSKKKTRASAEPDRRSLCEVDGSPVFPSKNQNNAGDIDVRKSSSPGRLQSIEKSPVYMLYDVTSTRRRSKGISNIEPDKEDCESQIYEDIDAATICTTLSNENDSMTEDFPCRRLEGHRQCSSDDSWGSGDFESFSSDDEDKNEAKTTSTIKAFFNGGRSLLRDKWRESRSRSRDEVDRKSSTSSNNDASDQSPNNGERRFSRLFSLRRTNSTQSFATIGPSRGSTMPANMSLSTDKEGTPVHSRMPSLTEEEELFNCGTGTVFQRRYQPPTLPPAPPGLTPEQFKRRQIVATIVHSENSYVATLQRLVHDYKKHLEESNPPIMSQNKISTIFHRLPQILHCHNLFRVSLVDCVRHWDRDEKLGEVFVASFSKAVVLDIYSDFVNNFSNGMELAKLEAKRKSAFADFLKVKQISSHDRLSFFGLMVKPVQRFPQFILLLQDLIKHTPPGHQDRMSLQMALTQLESLAELLNERKREAEQIQAFRESLKRLSGKFSVRPLSDGNRYLLRQDDVTLVEFGPCGAISKTKDRRLLLLNDLLLCVAVTCKEGDEYRNNERLQLKWAHPVSDIEVEDMSASPTLSRLLGGVSGLKSSEITSTVDQLCQEMNLLMQDYETLSRISNLVQSLGMEYEGLSHAGVQQALASIQRAIQSKDEAMAWVDNCCLHISVKPTSGVRGKEEKYTFQLESPLVRKDWMTELRLAQLALDPRHAPAWELPETEHSPLAKLPLFVMAKTVHKSQIATEVRCGCFYTLLVPKSSRTTGGPVKTQIQSYVWIVTVDGLSSRISVSSMQPASGPQIKELGCIDLLETKVTAMEFTPALVQEPDGGGRLYGDMVWVGTESRRVILYSARDAESPHQLSTQLLPSAAHHMKYHCDQLLIALANGSLAIYRRCNDFGWDIAIPQQLVSLGNEPVVSLLGIGASIYAACGKNAYMLDGYGCEVQRQFSLQHDQQTTISGMAHAGVGLWLALKNSSTICLYHTETFRHLQDINIASHVSRVINDQARNTPRNIYVTTLMAAKGVLWVGTNVGVTLNIPLPKLQGVPIISGRANVSYHAHGGPVTMVLPLVYRAPVKPIVRTSESKCVTIQAPGDSRESVIQEENETDLSPVIQKKEARLAKQHSDGSLLDERVQFHTMPSKLKHQNSCSPVLMRRESKERQNFKRMSRTLPRGFGLVSASSFNEFDIYGLYNELMNVKEFENNVTQSSDPLYETLRRSDPDLSNMATRISTLDRRLTLKSTRPRSLDLSSWSVDSRSSAYTNSSGSDDKGENTSIGSSTSGTGTVSSASSGTVRTIKPSISRSVSVRTKRGQDTISKSSDPNLPRTIVTLVGGRGYVNLKSGEKRASTVLSTTDAHVIVWEMKL